MSQGYQIYDQNQLYFLTFQIVKWVDVFTRNEYKQIVVNSFEYCRKHKGLELYGYVIMTNHIHLIARAKEPFRLSDICLAVGVPTDRNQLLTNRYLVIMNFFHKRQGQMDVKLCYFYTDTIVDFKHLLADDPLKMLVISSL